MRGYRLLNWTALFLACCSGAAELPALAQTNDTENVKLKTKDGVKLGATYYPSNLGRQAVPIVMLHDHKESRAVFNALARELQNPTTEDLQSHAVLTVDLRGHGESTLQVSLNGRSRELEAARLRPADYQAMVLRDMEAVRRFLRQKNDAEQLNLNKLCLLGSGMGANVAALYAAYDWSVPPLARVKQGQDVKALILASPRRSFRGLSIMAALKQRDVRQLLSVLIVYGAEDATAAKDSKSIHKLLSKYHKMPPPDQRREKQDLFLFPLRTSLQGTRLFTNPDFAILPKLDMFIEARLSQQDFEWTKRVP